MSRPRHLARNRQCGALVKGVAAFASLATTTGIVASVSGGDAGPGSGIARSAAVDTAYLQQGSAAYLKFDVDNVPAQARIERATLLLHSDHALPSSLHVSSVPSTSWTGRSLSSRNAPAVTVPMVSARFDAATANAAIDVTPLVRRGLTAMRVDSATAGQTLSGGATANSIPQLQIVWRRVHLRAPAPAPSLDPGPPATVAPIIGTPLPTPSTSPSTDPTPSPSTSPSSSPSPSISPSPSTSPSTSPSPTPSPSPSQLCTVSALLVPSCGVWFGMNTNNDGTGRTPDQQFVYTENEVGRPFDIFHYYYKDDQHFPSQTLINLAHEPGKNRLLLLNWKPATDHTWAQVAAGAVDARIDSEAAYLKSHYTDKFFLVIWHEPENDVNPTAGSGMTAADYAAMWRHVVLRLRGDGVTNAVTVICYEATPDWAAKSWWPQLWPGSDVVDWMGQDAYNSTTNDFNGMVNRTAPYLYPNWDGFYNWAQRVAPGKPMMLPEWGYSESSSDPNRKASFFNSIAAQLPSWPAVKALVFYNHANNSYAFDSSAQSLSAFKALANQRIVNPQSAFGERFN